MTVRALVDGQLYAEGTHVVEVTNREPMEDLLEAIEIDPETSTVEFTASARDVPGDPLLYRWDFGDGNTEEGEDLWTVRHQYLVPGTYTATVTFIDQDGAENTEDHTVHIRGAGGSNSTQPDDDALPATDVTVDGFVGTLSGALNGQIDAEIRSTFGLYLNRVKSGACRFTFTAWDDAHLAQMLSVIDLNGLPPDGASYQIARPNMVITFQPDAESYRQLKRSWFGRMEIGGLGGTVDALASILTEAQRQATADAVGVDPQAREAREPQDMPATSPFGLTESAKFSSESGNFHLTFIPGIKASGQVNIVMNRRTTAARPETLACTSTPPCRST